MNYFFGLEYNKENNRIMSFLWFIIIGIVAGYVAGKIMRGGGFGLIVNLVVGIIGGVLGAGCSVCWVFIRPVGLSAVWLWLRSGRSFCYGLCLFSADGGIVSDRPDYLSIGFR